MSDASHTIEEARKLLASGHEAQAVRLLRDAIHATEDPEQLQRIHEVAAEEHDRAGGFHKLEWHKLVVESEPHAGQTATGPGGG